jgi:hypothetical protein
MTGNLRAKLAKLERVAFDATGGGRCRMCWGDPQAVFLVVHEVAPDRKSIRATGDVYLADESMGKFTEDVDALRCLGCGAKARKALVMHTPGIGPARTGKKLVAA